MEIERQDQMDPRGNENSRISLRMAWECLKEVNWKRSWNGIHLDIWSVILYNINWQLSCFLTWEMEISTKGKKGRERQKKGKKKQKNQSIVRYVWPKYQ